MMKLVVGLILTLLVPSSYSVAAVCDGDPGTYSGVICVSKTEFKFDAADPITDVLECPAGEFCADVPEICTATVEPLCKNTVAGSPGTCSECRIATGVHKVCISETEYAICNTGNLLDLKYTCAASKQYCKYTTDVADLCTPSKVDLDCSGATGGGNSGTGNSTTTTTTTTTTVAPSVGGCTEEGLFPDPTDKSCVKYYKCTRTTTGTFVTYNFQCGTLNFRFNPGTQRCESTYVCPV